MNLVTGMPDQVLPVPFCLICFGEGCDLDG